MQRAFGAVFVAVLVVLAGCNGVLGGGSNEPAVMPTPASVPTDEPTPTPVPQLAPGLTGEGIENGSALVAAHGSFLQNTSFAMTSNSTTIATNGSVLVQRTNTLRTGPNGEEFYFVSELNGSLSNSIIAALPVRTVAWSDGEGVYLKRISANGTVTYDQLRTDFERLRYNLVRGSLPSSLNSFGPANTTVTRQFIRNGTTLYRVEGTAIKEVEGNVSLRLLVDSRGVVHEYESVRQISFEENLSKLVYETGFSKIGATDVPERPSWVDEALNRTTPTRPTETTRGGG